MAQLPQKLTLDQMQQRWASILNPIIGNPVTSPIVLKSVALINGTTTVNHLLGQPLQGWKVIRQRAAASIHDNQDSNQTPQLTLILISTAAVVVDLEVF